jgi:hypothetical protein
MSDGMGAYALSGRRGAAERPYLEFAPPLLVLCWQQLLAGGFSAHEMTPAVVQQRFDFTKKSQTRCIATHESLL